jgi:hypothetical protein
LYIYVSDLQYKKFVCLLNSTLSHEHYHPCFLVKFGDCFLCCLNASLNTIL